MGMLNWQGWAATNFVGWGSIGTATPPVTSPYPGPAGKSKRERKKYVIGDKTYSLTQDELEQALEVVLENEPIKELPAPLRKSAKALKAMVAAAPAPRSPTYPDLPKFDALWESLTREAPDMVASLRDVALRLEAEREIERDDEEIFQLLRMMPDDE